MPRVGNNSSPQKPATTYPSPLSRCVSSLIALKQILHRKPRQLIITHCEKPSFKSLQLCRNAITVLYSRWFVANNAAHISNPGPHYAQYANQCYENRVGLVLTFLSFEPTVEHSNCFQWPFGNLPCFAVISPDDGVAAPGGSGPGRLTIPLPPTGQPGMAEKRSNVVQVFFKCSL